MARYLVIDAEWLEREIANSEVLQKHAQGSGKPIAVAAAGVRLGTLREIAKAAVPGLPEGEGSIPLSLAAAPPSAGPGLD